MAKKMKLSQLTEDLHIYPQVLVNDKVKDKAVTQADKDVQDAVKEYLPEDCNPAIVESLQFQYEEPDIDEYLERLQEETEGLDCEPG